MAAPSNLYQVFARGVGGSDPAEEPRWEWTTTHHLTIEPDDVDLAATAIILRAWWLGRVAFQSFGVGTTWAANTWLTSFKIVKVSAGTTDEIPPFTIACGVGLAAPDSVCPQVALLTWAQTEVIGIESRLYLPGQTRDSLELDPQRWKTAVYTARLAALWGPTVVGGKTCTPVIYSPDLDTVFPVTRAKYTRWPRTQRRRGLSLRGFEVPLI